MVYAIVGLIAEVSWFYLPLSLAAFSIVRETSIPRRLVLWLAGSLLAVAAFVAMEVTNHVRLDKMMSPEQTAIMESWRSLYPDAYKNDLGALTCIGLPLRSSWGMVIFHQSHLLTFSGYIIGFVLANVPLALLGNRKARLAWFSWLEISAGITAMLLTFAVAADWGRYAYLFTCQVFMFVILTTESVPLKSVTRAITLQTIGRCCLGLLFLTAWQLNHFVPGGTDPLRPGLLFMRNQPAE